MKTDRLSFGLNIHTCDTIKKIVAETPQKAQLDTLVKEAANDGINGDLSFSFSDMAMIFCASVKKHKNARKTLIPDVFLQPYDSERRQFEENKPASLMEFMQIAYDNVKRRLAIKNK